MVKSNQNRSTLTPKFSAPDYGKQMMQVVKNGLGATLRTYPEVIDFGKVYMNPFSYLEAKLPFLPVYSSKTIRTVARGNAALGTNGFGYITCKPMNGCVSNIPSVTFSTAAFTGVSITAFGATGVAQTNAAKTPYTTASFAFGNTNALGVRIVAYGIRTRYIGTTLNASGDWYGAQINPKLTNIGFDQDAFAQVQGYKKGSFANRKWQVYNRMLTSRIDMEYAQYDLDQNAWVFFQPVSTTDENNQYLGIVFSGVAGMGIEFEVCGHYEVIGPNLDTESMGKIDEQTANHIVTKANELRYTDNTRQDHLVPQDNENPETKVKSFFGSIASDISQVISKPSLSSIAKIGGELLPFASMLI